MEDKITLVLDYMNEVKTRCTYTAAAKALGITTTTLKKLLGERRPEIVMGPAHVVGGDQTSKMMGNSVGSITINMNGGGGERENRRAAGEIARQVKRAVSEAGRY